MPLAFHDARQIVLAEVADSLAAIDERAIDAGGQLVADAARVFVVGAGRSALALKMSAMRWMHFGLPTHVVGETTTPAIAEGDVLVAASGSGTTASVVHCAGVAAWVGAKVLAITSDATSPLAAKAAVLIRLRAVGKQDHGNPVSQQYAGSLFEQSLLLTLDSLFHAMWKASGLSREQLWANHANLE